MRRWLLEAADRLIAHAPELTELDARIGDGDHGINLARGMGLVRDALLAGTPRTAAADLGASGRTLISSVGGASGPLYGTLLLEIGEGLEDAADASALGHALVRGAAAVGRRGRSTVGQKTMLDALVPAAEAFAAAQRDGADLGTAALAAGEAARLGCDSTRPMVAQRGRASYLGERAVGHLDPGAVSSRMLVEALVAAVGAPDQPPASTSARSSR